MNRLSLLIAVVAILIHLPGRAAAQGASGFAEAKGFSYFHAGRHDDPLLVGWGTLFTKWEAATGGAQLTASLRAEGITSENEQGSFAVDPADRRLRRSPLSAQDLWIRVPLAPSHDLQVGRFLLGWGKTDGYSPADAFLPRDLSDPFVDEKIPLWCLRLVGQAGNIRYDAVASPVTTPWRLPALGSRNAPVPGAAGISYREEEQHPPNAGFAALRLLGTFGDWDVGAWGRFGVRPAPILVFGATEAGSGGPVVSVRRRFPHEEAAGIEISRIIGSWIVRGETALLLSRDPAAGNAVVAALSTERGFGDGTLLVTIAASAADRPVAEELLFDRATLPVLISAWNRTEEWGDWKVVWSTGLKRGDGVLKGEIGYNFTDVWKVTAGADIPYGDHAGPFGALENARRLRLAIRRSW